MDNLDDEDDDGDDNNSNNNYYYSSISKHSLLRELLLKVKRIVRFVRTSEVASNELKKLQQQDKPGIPALKLINEVKTQWNSCFDMLERFLQLADPVSRVLFQVQRDKSSRAKPPSMLRVEELEALSEVKDLLKILNRVTREVSAEKCVTISKCIPIVKGILNLTENFNASTPISYNLQRKLVAEINNKFSKIEVVEVYALATLLDPRYKKKAFQCIRGSARAVTQAGKLIRQEIQQSKAVNNDSAILCSNVTNMVEITDDDDIWNYLDNEIRIENQVSDTDEAGGLPIQLRQYLTRPGVERKANPNPFVIWNSMKAEYPHIWNVAKKYLSIMATSVPCERLFSQAGIIATQKRSRLSPKDLNMLLFLRSLSGDELWFS